MQNDETLRNFMREFFPFTEFRKAGIFTKEMKGDYLAQSQKICHIFGYKTIYEYGAKEIRCHLSLSNPNEKDTFITELKNIYK